MDLQTALAHHQAGRLDAAVLAYQQILEHQPDHADALHLMGYATRQLGDLPRAIALVSRAIALAPDNANYHLSLADAQQRAGQLESALSNQLKACTLAPQSAFAHFACGNTLLALGRSSEAEQRLLAALALQPDFIEARFNLANLQKAAGRHAEALLNYQGVVELKPDFADAHHNMGSALDALGRDEEALASYQLALHAHYPETHNNLGNLFMRRQQPAEAAAHYQQALTLKPAYPEAWNNLGNALRQLDRDADALAAFATAIQLKPDHIAALRNLGYLQLERGDHAAALDAFARALACDPQDADSHISLGVAHQRRGALTDALACFTRARQLRPAYIPALFNCALIHGKLDQREEAEQGYRQILALDPAHIDSQINLSALLTLRGETREARRLIASAYSRQNIFERRSKTARRSVLILFDTGRGNINLSHLFDEARNHLIDWMIEYATPQQFTRLPAHDLIFNAMGDPDMTADIRAPLEAFLRNSTRPLLNPPQQVARTARHRLPALLEGIAGLNISPVWRCEADETLPAGLAQHLPLLMRPVHTQGGEGLVKIDSAEALAQHAAARSGPVYFLRFIDYRAADGCYRKYRVIFIDRQPYPYHLAISRDWMVHYYTAGMPEHAWKLAEEKAFLADPEAALGAAAMSTLRAIGQRLDLDYAGIDFSIDRDGRLLVFEANPTMLVHPENDAGILAHKNPGVQRILQAFDDMLERAARRCA